MDNNELTHWGIRGMKWGIRRYQNKDGTLTPAGKQRRDKIEADLKAREKVIKNKERNKSTIEKLEAKKKELDERDEALKGKGKTGGKGSSKGETSGQKSFKDMTDAELYEKTSRMILETNYLTAQQRLAAANPKKVSAGEQFTKSVMNDVVAPAAKNAGRAWLEKFMKDKLGLNNEDPITRLEKHARKLELEKKIDDLRNKKGDDGYSLDSLLEAYRNIPDATRDELKEAAQIQENINKLRKKSN